MGRSCLRYSMQIVDDPGRFWVTVGLIIRLLYDISLNIFNCVFPSAKSTPINQGLLATTRYWKFRNDL